MASISPTSVSLPIKFANKAALRFELAKRQREEVFESPEAAKRHRSDPIGISDRVSNLGSLVDCVDSLCVNKKVPMLESSTPRRPIDQSTIDGEIINIINEFISKYVNHLLNLLQGLNRRRLSICINEWYQKEQFVPAHLRVKLEPWQESSYLGVTSEKMREHDQEEAKILHETAMAILGARTKLLRQDYENRKAELIAVSSPAYLQTELTEKYRELLPYRRSIEAFVSSALSRAKQRAILVFTEALKSAVQHLEKIKIEEKKVKTVEPGSKGLLIANLINHCESVLSSNN